MKRIERMFAIAREAAIRGPRQRYNLGAVVAKGNRVISIGRNNMAKTHPLISRGSHKLIHAEVDACIGLDRDRLRGSSIYVYRETTSGEIAMAKPCVDCRNILLSFGVKTAHYTDPSVNGMVWQIRIS